MSRKKSKILACRFCGDEIDASNRDTKSHWTHNHASVCPYRQDSMPSLNGVHVGDRWRNSHTGRTVVVEAIRLGGCGTYTDREPVVVLADEESPSEWRYVSPYPLWSLSEHWEPLSRPGEWPVPWTRSRRWKGRSAQVKWRGGGIRRTGKNRKDAYYHSYLYRDGPYTSAGWGQPWQTNEYEQMIEGARLQALEFIASGQEELVKVGERIIAGMNEDLAEAA